MPTISGTYQTYDATGNREDIEDTIFNISPEETPLMSLISTTKVRATRHEWQVDTLRTPASNAQVEGDEYTFAEITPTTRVGNFCQISTDTLIISNTQDVVDKAGRDREVAYQIAKAGKELKKDIELSLVSNAASSAGSSVSGRVSAGFPAWIATNASREAGGSDGGFSSGTGLVTAATNGTQRAMTKAMIDDTMLSAYNAGGNPTILMVSPYLKTVFSKMLDDADVVGLRKTMSEAGKKQATITAAADAYVSDFGVLTVVPNRVMGSSAGVARNAFLIDTDYVKRGVLRPMKTEVLAKTGDAEKRALVTEYCLVMSNEAAHGVIADLYGLTASS